MTQAQHEDSTRIYIGDDTPSTDSLTHVDAEHCDVVVYHGPVSTEEVDHHFSESISLREPIFHDYLLTDDDVEHLEHAVGSRGSYPQRENCHSQGSISFLGTKSSFSLDFRPGRGLLSPPRASINKYKYPESLRLIRHRAKT